MPVKKHINLRRTASGGRTNGNRAGDVFHCFLDWPGDASHHFIRGHDAIIHQDDDAGEVGLRKYGRRSVPRRVHANQTEHSRHERNGQRVFCRKPAQTCAAFGIHGGAAELVCDASVLAGFATAILVLSGKPYAPTVTTGSPAFSPVFSTSTQPFSR